MCLITKAFLCGMASKETPKKVYSTVESIIDPTPCRFCRAVGDASHRKNIFKPLNKHLLRIAEQICGNTIAKESGLPHLVCRPCERRLKNTIEFQKVILEAEQSFRERQSNLDVSPSVPQPPRSRLATAGTAPSARIALSFDSTVEVSMISIYNNTLIIVI